jgi:SPP1 family predicted phage head-tail adaptor
VTLPRLSSRPPGPGEYTSPGALNRRVTFNNAANPTAGVMSSPFIDSWAAIRAMGGQEMDKAQQFAQRSTHLVTVPYQPGILENMTVNFNEAGTTRSFQIEYIEDTDERHVELRMMCFEMNQNAGSAS